MSFKAHAGNAKRSQSRPDFEYTQILCQRNDIDSEQHAKGMNAGRRPNEHTASSTEAPLTEKAEQSGGECIRKNNSRAYRYALPGIFDSYALFIVSDVHN